MATRALPGEVAGGLRALSTEIDRLDQAAADRYGLNRTDMRALDILGRPDPGDRRRQLVETTEATAARDEEVFGELIRGTRNLLADYTDDELLVIRGFLDRVRQLTAAHADALGSHARPGPGNTATTRHGRG